MERGGVAAAPQVGGAAAALSHEMQVLHAAFESIDADRSGEVRFSPEPASRGAHTRARIEPEQQTIYPELSSNRPDVELKMMDRSHSTSLSRVSSQTISLLPRNHRSPGNALHQNI